jgi:protein TonB
VSGGALLARTGALCLLLLAAAQDAAGPAAAAPPQYRRAAELDARPQIRTHVMPEYPAALPAGVRGRVVLELYISSAGTLDRIRVARAEPAGRFEQAALKAFSGARFTPGILKGKAVPSVILIEVSFGD